MSILGKMLDATKQAVGSVSATIKDNAPDSLGRITSAVKDGLGSARDTAKAGLDAVGASTVVSRASSAVLGASDQVVNSTIGGLEKLADKMERTAASLRSDAAKTNKTDKDA